MLPISMGNSDFKEIREEGYYYVDKSLLIRELLQDKAKVVLLPRPRRFGKTLNLKMCEAFFSDLAPNPLWFEGLAIAADLKSMKHFGAYPTVGLTFKDLHADSWESCQVKLKMAVSELFQRFEDQLEPSPAQAQTVRELIHMNAPIEQVERALVLLTQLLHKQRGKKVVVLIDEYDAPIQDGYFFGFYDKIVAFMRGFLGAVLKDNPHLRKGVLTGVLRIAQESLFSGLNNIQVYTVLDHKYSDCFGFTEQEVQAILKDCQMQAREGEIRAWYNGYKMGQQTLYNPWSILSVAANAHDHLRSYWINTAQDKLIENLITREGCLSLADLSSLLKGETLVKEIRPSVALNRIDGQSIWSLLLFSGYLTYAEQISESHYSLRLPNQEVRSFFELIVRRWIEGSEPQLDPLQPILLKGDLAAFKAFVKDHVLRLVGINDTSGRSVPENFYHGLILGLVAYRLDEHYLITSNRESGHGRYDIQLCPRTPGVPGYIFEFKSMKKSDEEALRQGAEQALSQIMENAYSTDLHSRGVTPLILVGIAFHGKQLEMTWCESKEQAPQRDLLRLSPFRIGNALPGDSEVFVGREQETQLILNRLDRQSFLILGSRQIGKTSFLRFLAKRLETMGFHAIQVDCQGVTSVQNFIHYLKPILEKVGQAWPEGNDPIFQIESALGTMSKPVLLLNEIDGLSLYEPLLIQRLRSMSEAGHCQCIMTGSLGALHQTRDPEHPLYPWFSGMSARNVIPLRGLSVEAARALIAKLKFSALALNWADSQTEQEGVNLILQHTHLLPILIQHVCQALVERLAAEGRTVIQRHDLQLIAEQHLAWDYIQAIRFIQGEFSAERQPVAHLLLALQVDALFPKGGGDSYEQMGMREQESAAISFDTPSAWSALSAFLKRRPAKALEAWATEHVVDTVLKNWCFTPVLAPHPTRPDHFYFPNNTYPIELIAYLQRRGLTSEEYLKGLVR